MEWMSSGAQRQCDRTLPHLLRGQRVHEDVELDTALQRERRQVDLKMRAGPCILVGTQL
jgi:hypothetical protein